MTKSQTRLLDRLRSLPVEELTDEDREDLDELIQLEKSEEKKEDQKDDPLEKINQSLEEIKTWMKPQELKPQEKVEIPTPQPVITNQDLQDQDQPKAENKLKTILKALW